jgi:2-desacetyl-2-hydroxyethyl bacteriochlorophyllide A dehydrogenase
MLAARAFWTIGKGVGEIREESIAPPGPGEVLVETLHSAISRGTEWLVLHGRVPESEHERMRAPHQAGAFPFPVKYGYLNVGRVAEGPSDLEGRVVFCLYPHQSRYVVAASDVVVVPDGVEPARAVLAGNLETAINGIWDADVRVGDRVAIVGAGVVGSLAAYVAGRIAGCRVELVDVLPERARVAAALGVGFASPASARREADVVIHASGASAGLATALALAGQESTVVEMSWYGDRATELQLGGAFHARRLTLRSSQVGGISASQRARWTSRRRLELALSLLDDSALDVLFDGEDDFDDLPAVLPRLTTGLCHRLRYPPAPCSPSASATT